MKTASRTLVKSPPEVWEQLDHQARMEGLMSALVGHATQVEVYERVEESKLAWRAGEEARIEVELAEKGWGTNVSVSADGGPEPTKLEGWLDAVLDELATPTKRPFEGMSEAPSGTLAQAITKKPEPALVAAPTDESPVVEPAAEEAPATQADEPRTEEPQTEQPPAEEALAEEPQLEEPAVEQPPPPAPEPPKKRRRFFGLF